MNTRQLTFGALIAASVFIAMPKAHAFYATPSVAGGWVAGGGATYGTLPARLGTIAAADGSTWWGTSATLNAGGRTVTLPAVGRFAANAGRFAARGIVASPLAMGVAGAAWLASECIGYQGGSFVRTCGLPEAPNYPNEYQVRYTSLAPWYPSAENACQAAGAYTLSANPGYNLIAAGVVDGRCNVRGNMPGYQAGTTSYDIATRAEGGCPYGWWKTDAGCQQERPPQTMTPQEVEEKMAPKTVPPEVYPEIPNVPLPIDAPKINPGTGPSYPSQPLYVPNGAPTKVPNSNPEVWRHPVITITPAPSTDNPFRVDLTPQEVKKNDPTPFPEPFTGPLPNVQMPPVVDPNNPPVTDPNTDPEDPNNDDPDKDPEEEPEPTDSELPPLPKLYEPKYPQGLEGVWQEQKDKLAATSLAQLAGSLMPKVTGGGSCPTWNVDLDFAGWASYGSKNVAPPCEVWDWGRMIILVSALILARALIFGG